MSETNGIFTINRLAIEEAIRNNILKEILRNNKAEVTNMLLTEFDEKDYIKGVKEEYIHW